MATEFAVELVPIIAEQSTLVHKLMEAVRDDPLIHEDFYDLFETHRTNEDTHDHLRWKYGDPSPIEHGYVAVLKDTQEPIALGALSAGYRCRRQIDEPQEFFKSANLWYLVHSDYRRRGIARRMCQQLIEDLPILAEKYPKRWGNATLWTMVRNKNTASRDLILSLGLKPVDSILSEIGSDEPDHDYFIQGLTEHTESIQ